MRWMRELHSAAERQAQSADKTDTKVKEHLTRIFAQQILRKGALKRHTIAAWKLENLTPKLRNELDKRILASAQLIKLNREEMIQKTLQRLSGWATSLPIGPNLDVNKREEADNIRKSFKQLPFTERRVVIDQSFKFKASLDDIIAKENGAIAGIWKCRHTANYSNRKDHLERENKVYFVRGNWAIQDGYVKLAGHEYMDEITAPGQEIYCSCVYVWLYSIKKLPEECITNKGKEL